MAWIFNNKTGTLYHRGKLIWKAYSGKGEGLLNPVLQCTKNVGPIPSGKYKIGLPRKSERTGPHVMDLYPNGHSACGRSAFQIHGDNSKKNKSASKGCIILPRSIREKISNSDDNILIVKGPLWIGL